MNSKMQLLAYFFQLNKTNYIKIRVPQGSLRTGRRLCDYRGFLGNTFSCLGSSGLFFEINILSINYRIVPVSMKVVICNFTWQQHLWLTSSLSAKTHSATKETFLWCFKMIYKPEYKGQEWSRRLRGPPYSFPKPPSSCWLPARRCQLDHPST